MAQCSTGLHFIWSPGTERALNRPLHHKPKVSWTPELHLIQDTPWYCLVFSLETFQRAEGSIATSQLLFLSAWTCDFLWWISPNRVQMARAIRSLSASQSGINLNKRQTWNIWFPGGKGRGIEWKERHGSGLYSLTFLSWPSWFSSTAVHPHRLLKHTLAHN